MLSGAGAGPNSIFRSKALLLLMSLASCARVTSRLTIQVSISHPPRFHHLFLRPILALVFLGQPTKAGALRRSLRRIHRCQPHLRFLFQRCNGTAFGSTKAVQQAHVHVVLCLQLICDGGFVASSTQSKNRKHVSVRPGSTKVVEREIVRVRLGKPTGSNWRRRTEKKGGQAVVAPGWVLCERGYRRREKHRKGTGRWRGKRTGPQRRAPGPAHQENRCIDTVRSPRKI